MHLCTLSASAASPASDLTLHLHSSADEVLVQVVMHCLPSRRRRLRFAGGTGGGAGGGQLGLVLLLCTGRLLLHCLRRLGGVYRAQGSGLGDGAQGRALNWSTSSLWCCKLPR